MATMTLVHTNPPPGGFHKVAEGSPTDTYFVGSDFSNTGDVWSWAVPGFARTQLTTSRTDMRWITYGTDGFLYGNEQGGSQGGIFKIDPSSGVATRWDTLGFSYFSTTGSATGIARLADGAIWLCGSDGNYHKFSAVGDYVTTYNPPTFNGCFGIVSDGSMLYAGDTAGDVWSIDAETGSFTLLGDTGGANGWWDTTLHDGSIYMVRAGGGSPALAKMPMAGGTISHEVEPAAVDGHGFYYVTSLHGTLYGLDYDTQTLWTLDDEPPSYADPGPSSVRVHQYGRRR